MLFMRKNIIKSGISATILFLTINWSANGQVSPTTGFHLAATPVAQPPAYINPTVNYIRIWEPIKPTTDVVDVTGTARTVGEIRQSTIYSDGLGRPIQSVIKGVSGSGKDMVTPSVYDAYGRQQLLYLPYVQTTGNTNDGKLKLSPFASQQVFLSNPGLNPSGAGESIFYGQQIFEESPSSPVQKSYQPGNSWALEGGKKPVQQYTFSNTVSDSVRVWKVVSDLPTSPRTYPAGELSKRITIDANSNQVIEYFDKSGNLVLKKVQNAASPGSAHIGWLCTYYAYDDLGRLRIVFPPLATEKMMPSWSPTAVLAGLCTIYRYDTRERNIVVKLPGVDSLETVFDVRDRPILFRDGALKSKGKWLLTFYDGLDRPVKTALYSNATITRESLQVSASAAAAGSLPFIAAGSYAEENYYFYDDNYAFPGALAPLTGDFGAPQKGTNSYEVPNTEYSHRAMGKLTGVRSRIAATNQWLTTTIYYNDKGRVLQTIQDNIYSGKQTTTFLYDFSGKVLSTYIRQTNPHSTVTPETRILICATYNPVGNLTEISTTINDVTSTKRVVASYTYDELGNVRTKTLPKESQSFDLNINGQLTAINKAYVTTPGSSSNWFGEELAYDFGFSASQFDGSIAGAKWKGRGDGIARAHGFSYDKPGRLSVADFSQQNQGSTAWLNDKVDFTVNGLSYDANGNVLSLKQRGLKGLAKATIDSLKYGYSDNRLLYVTDGVNDPNSKLGDFKEVTPGTSIDYTYDIAGNILKDSNRVISERTYNYLNLPDYIGVTGKGKIAYLYDASGEKIRKTVTDAAGKVTVYDYMGGFVYKNDSLQYFDQPEGRIRALYATGKPVQLVYDYFLTDHVGNTRVVLTEESGKQTYAATLETAGLAKENALFANINTTRVAKPVGYPADATTNPNDFVAKLNASAGSQKIGPSLVLRVMAGDTVQAGSKAFYKSAAASTSSTTVANMLAALIQAFATGTGPTDGVHGNGTGAGSPITNFTSANYQSIRDKDPSQNVATMPKAYLAYVLFDEQMNMVDENSGVRQVQGSPDQLQTLATSLMVMKKTGFLYVYTTNESIQDVYFDNIVVNHNPGPLLEETHYYPFGLTMAGISSKALKNPYSKNNYNYNGIEQTDEFGLNQYDAYYRTLDPQIGRWNQVDPAAIKYPGISPYNSNFNNPISIFDPLGDDPPFWGLVNGVWGWQYRAFDVVGQQVGRSAVEAGIRSFTTNGFNQIGAYAARQQQMRQAYELQRLQSLQRSYDIQAQIDLQQSQQIEMNNGFPVRQFEDPNTTGAAWRRGMGKAHKSFIFVTDYVEPVVTNVATLGLEGLVASGAASTVGRTVVSQTAEGAAGGNRLWRWLRTGGKTFNEYKAARGGTETLARIRTTDAAGRAVEQRISTEFHHWLITQRMQRAYGIPNWLVNNRLNVLKLNTVQHSLIDPMRFRFLRAGFKQEIGWFRGEYTWFTKF
ncbi:RHS repeat-associated protein [Chitinophaga sp. OAE865]